MKSTGGRFQEMLTNDWLRAFATRSEHNRNDLHVDRFDAVFEDPGTWSDAAIQCFRIAVDVARFDKLPVTVAMELFLEASQVPTGYGGGRVQDLRFSWTPPALTVFDPDSVPWKQSDAFTPVEADTGLPSGVVMHSYYQEWFDESEGDYDRRLWLVGG